MIYSFVTSWCCFTILIPWKNFTIRFCHFRHMNYSSFLTAGSNLLFVFAQSVLSHTSAGVLLKVCTNIWMGHLKFRSLDIHFIHTTTTALKKNIWTELSANEDIWFLFFHWLINDSHWLASIDKAISTFKSKKWCWSISMIALFPLTY